MLCEEEYSNSVNVILIVSQSERYFCDQSKHTKQEVALCTICIGKDWL